MRNHLYRGCEFVHAPLAHHVWAMRVSAHCMMSTFQSAGGFTADSTLFRGPHLSVSSTLTTLVLLWSLILITASCSSVAAALMEESYQQQGLSARAPVMFGKHLMQMNLQSCSAFLAQEFKRLESTWRKTTFAGFKSVSAPKYQQKLGQMPVELNQGAA
mmetsp:Transcript_115477/g.326408  ORF Transcript_115477/g.326408 Transcript_115477/m.326408 type:complete len:159 (-) Transcript_115477:147-623(-)